MNIHAVVPLAASISFIPLFILLLFNRPWNRGRKVLFWYLVPAILWSFIDFLFRSDYLIEYKLIVGQISLAFAIWMAIQFLYIMQHFSKKQPLQRFNLPLIYLLLLALIVLEALGYIPQSIDISGTGVIDVHYGVWFSLIVLCLLVAYVINIYFLIRRLVNTNVPEERNQIFYLFAGFLMLLAFGLASFLPGAGSFPVGHFGNLALGVILSYVFLKHRLVDMIFITRRALFWIASLVVGILGYLAIYLAVSSVTGIVVDSFILTASILGVFMVSMGIYMLRGVFETAIERFFFRRSYEYRLKLSDFAENKLVGVSSLRELSDGLLPLVARSLDCQKVYLLLPESQNGDFVVAFAEPQSPDMSLLRLRQDNPVLEWLKHGDRHLSIEDIVIQPQFLGLWTEEKNELAVVGLEFLFPILSRGNLIGILGLGEKNSGKYAVEEVYLVTDTIHKIAAGLEKECLQEQLRKREQELTLINRLDRVITSSLNIQEVYDAFVAGLKDVVDVDWATITWVEGDEIIFGALSTEVGSAWQVGERIPLKDTATEWVIRNKKAMVESDLKKNSRFWTTEEYIKRGIRSIAYLPLLVKGSVIGSLIIASRRPDAYNPEQISLLDRLSHQIAVSVENSRLYTKAEQRARVDELTRLFNRRHFDECLRREIAIQSRSGGVLSLIFLDLDHFKEYNDNFGHPDGDRTLAHVGFMITKSIRNEDLAFRYGGDEFAIILPGAVGRDTFVVAERIRNKIASEMKAEQAGITASLGLSSWPSDGVTPDDVVTAADRALYYAKRTGGNRTRTVSEMLPQQAGQTASGTKTEKEALSTIYALASTIEARDQYTYGHSRNVSRYAVALAEALGLSSERVAIVGTAALLHDIGKIGIADEVLNKADKLNDEEWELIRYHPRLSAAIVGHVLSLTPCLPAILYHQEKWDGTGYPSGLSGEAIPLEARILSVADAFEAMTSPRPYRGPMSTKDALEELKRNVGSQFDPKIADAFLPIALSTVPEDAETGKSLDI